MAKNNDSKNVQVVHDICCGLDVHKQSISACLLKGDDRIFKTFGTVVQDLEKLRVWLGSNNCKIVAMESTGVYWKPVFNLLENDVEVMIVNARHFKNVPGRKTDIRDCEWLAGLLRHGLVRGSFIPRKEVREWRDVSRQRKTFVDDLGNYKRRVHKLLESANIKIDSVVSDLFGATGRNLMNLLIASKDITRKDVESCLRGSLQNKGEQLWLAVQGRITDHHRFLLKGLFSIIGQLQSNIYELDDRLTKLTSGWSDQIVRLSKIPGVSHHSACAIISEIGTDLKEFRNEAALASWSGLCPGNNESAGKRRSGRNPVRKHLLRTLLIEVAWAAVKRKGSYYKDKYYKLRGRLGPKKAIVAIAHRILAAIYHIIKNGADYKELGEDYLSLRNKEKRLEYLSTQARLIGFKLIPMDPIFPPETMVVSA